MKRKKLRVALMSALIALGGTSLALGSLVSCGGDSTEAAQYTVTYEASDDYTISIASGSTYAEGEEVSFTVTVASGKVLESVTANGAELVSSDGTTYSFIMPNSNVTLVVTVSDAAAQYTFEATATGTWAIGETLTITATLNNTGTTDFTITATTGADLVDINNTAKTVELVAGGDVVLTVTTEVDGVTLTDTIEGTIAEANYSISQITGTGDYTIRGTVVAKGSSLFLVYDGEAGISVYGSSLIDTVEVGNYVQVSGSVTTYSTYFWQYSYEGTTVEVLSDEGEAYEPTELTAEIADSIGEKTENLVTDVAYYSWTATCGSTSGGYTTLNIDGSETLIEPMYVDTSVYTLIEGQKYEVKAWYYGYQARYAYAAVLLTDATLASAGITVTSESGATTLGISETLQLTATYDDPTNEGTVTWSSSDDEVATVSDAGLVTGVGGGYVVITATDTSNSEVYGAILLTVERTSATLHENASLADVAANTNYDGYDVYHVQNVQVSAISSSYARYGQISVTDGSTTVELYNSVYNTNYTNVLVEQNDGSYTYTYSGSGSSNITDLDNFVVGVKVDLYIIGQTSSYYNNYYGCIVDYSQVYPDTVTFDDGSSISLDINETKTLSVTTDPALVSVTPTWSSTNESAVTVDQDGTVIAVATGTSTVSVTYTIPESNSVTASITVNVSDTEYVEATPLGTYLYTMRSASASGSDYNYRLSNETIKAVIDDVNTQSETNDLITSATVDETNYYVYGYGSNNSPNYEGNYAGMKFGTSNTGEYGQFTITTSQAVDTVEISVIPWNGRTPTLYVNGVTYTLEAGDATTAQTATISIESATTLTIGQNASGGTARFILTGMSFYNLSSE